MRVVLSRVRKEVLNQTNKQQVPWDSSSLLGEFYFKLALPPPATVTATPAPTPSPTVPERSIGGFDERQIDLGFWESVRESQSAADIEAYLQSFPNGIFVALAHNKLRTLRQLVEAADVRLPSDPAPLAPPLEERASKGVPATVVPPSEPTHELAAVSPSSDVVSSPSKAALPAPPSNTEPSDTAIAALPVQARAVAEPTPAETEAMLRLSGDDWLALQRALTVLGFETRGADGKPGPNTGRQLARGKSPRKFK